MRITEMMSIPYSSPQEAGMWSTKNSSTISRVAKAKQSISSRSSAVNTSPPAHSAISQEIFWQRHKPFHRYRFHKNKKCFHIPLDKSIIFCYTVIVLFGEVLKWSKRRDSKSRRTWKRCVGSNPTFSARKKLVRKNELFSMMFAFGKWCWAMPNDDGFA